MAHPFFDPNVTKYPWHRREARCLHEALYENFPEPGIIKRKYHECAAKLPLLALSAAPDAIWTEALDNLTAHTGALRKLCELNQESKNARLQDAIGKVIDAKAEHLSPEHLSPEQIAALKKAFTTAGKSYDAKARRVLFTKVPQVYIDQLSKEEDDAAQLTSDLEHLNTTEQFEQQVPLKLWLENACKYFDGASEALVFKQTLEDLATHPSQRTDAGKAAEVFEKVWLKIQADDNARDAVFYYKKVFHGALKKIDVITDFKGLHEEIHTLQMGWPDNIDDEIKGLPSDPRVKLNVRKHARLLTNTVQRMNKIVENGNVKPGDMKNRCRNPGVEAENGQKRNGPGSDWLEALGRFQAEFNEAVTGSEEKKIREIFGYVSSCLSPTLSDLNTELKTGVEKLHLEENLIPAMREVCNVLIKLDRQRTAEKVSLYQAGINELQALGERLRDLKDQHDRWQEVDIKLKMFNTLLNSSIIAGKDTEPVMELFLTVLSNDIEPLYRESAADWAQELKSAAAGIRTALGDKDNNKAGQWFQNYCAQAAFRFYELDNEMKGQCDELSKVGDKLRKVDDELENM